MRRLIQLISIYEYFFYRKTHIRWTFSISITKESNWSDDILYLYLVYSLFVYLRMQIKRNEPNVFRLNAFKRRPYSARLEIFDCVSGWLNIICFIWFFNIFSIDCDTANCCGLNFLLKSALKISCDANCFFIHILIFCRKFSKKYFLIYSWFMYVFYFTYNLFNYYGSCLSISFI